MFIKRVYIEVFLLRRGRNHMVPTSEIGVRQGSVLCSISMY